MHRLIHKMLICLLATQGAVLILATAPAPAQIARPTTEGPLVGDSRVTNAERLLNRPVLGRGGEELGVVTDVLLNLQGDAEHLIVTRLGLLGMSEHSIALPLAAMNLRGDGSAILAPDISRDDMKKMPDFEYSDQVQSLYRAPRRLPRPPTD